MDTISDLHVVRAIPQRVSLRAADDVDDEGTDGAAGMPTMQGHFSAFDVWYEIDSWFEGRFLERIHRGAYKKTIRENRDAMKVLYDHGMDFALGNKVLGAIDELREDDIGAWYSVPLFDTSYNRDLIPGLAAGVYGASMRFRVIRDEWNDEPGISEHNPEGIPERTIRENRVFEFGPVTFPASPGGTAGLRSVSLTDDYYGRLDVRSGGRYADLLARARELRQADGHRPSHPLGDRNTAPPPGPPAGRPDRHPDRATDQHDPDAPPTGHPSAATLRRAEREQTLARIAAHHTLSRGGRR